MVISLSNGHAPRATVVIVTKDRRQELLRAIESAAQQTSDIEIVVVDDGSTDGTSDSVASVFPNVRLERSEYSRGYIHQRNRAANLARAPVIFSLDDDAVFDSANTIDVTLENFDHARIGAISLPVLEVSGNAPARKHRPVSEGRAYITDQYVGTAHAVRRDLFLSLNGYREGLAHQGEESDFGLRMLDAGYVVRLGTAEPIKHHASTTRDLSRMDYFGRRNDILFAWHNVPFPYLPFHLAVTTVHGLALALARRSFAMLRGLAGGYARAWDGRRDRRPVSPQVYRLARRLKKRGPVRLDDVERSLPPRRSLSQ
jgi:glycosyltransferase involved in cell wall biosynthesis